ncbi:MAG: EAL domain-containing protein [Thermodesulfovibrionales bacterium]|nr:EAL domain-containing protein [Thermodesulfovibrionales bacterium]
MQECHKCSIVSIIDSPCDVYLSATEPYLLSKVKEFYYKKDVSFKNLNDVLKLEEVSVYDIIHNLENNPTLTEIERGQILLTVIQHGQIINPQHLFIAKSLNVWIELLKSNDLLSVIRDRKITIFFQPIFHAYKVTPYAFECLSRGIAEDGRIIPPLRLFHQAKVLGLQFALDKLTREVAIEKSANHEIRRHKIFINFLPTAIYNPQDCLATTIKASELYEIRPENIVFEVVESENVQDINHLKSILDFYRNKGFKTALDDFGSGYASLKMLELLEADYVKIDMHFIKDIHKDKFKQSIVSSIISLCKEKSITTLAEGIENQKEFDCLRGLGIDLVQGYFLARPSPNISKALLEPK